MILVLKWMFLIVLLVPVFIFLLFIFSDVCKSTSKRASMSDKGVYSRRRRATQGKYTVAK